MESSILQPKTAGEVQAQDAAEAEAIQKAQEASQEAQTQNIASHIRLGWQKAQDFNRPFHTAMLANKRARVGEYEADKLAAIKAVQGPDFEPVFMMVTGTKCRDGQSWLKDILMQPGELPWDLSPTPIPELPEPIVEEINQKAMSAVLEQAMVISQMSGVPPTMEGIQAMFQDKLPEIRKFVDKEIRKKAKESAEKMKTKIADQFVEGGWYEALEACIYDIVTYKAAIMKGPIMRKEKFRSQKLSPMTGKWETVTEERIISRWDRVCPTNYFPSQDCTGVDDGDVYEKISMTRGGLNALIGVPGYKEEAIRRVLEQHKAGGLVEWTDNTQEKANLEGKTQVSVHDTNKIDCIEFCGSVPGSMLIEWGLEDPSVNDPEGEYDITAWLIGNEVIKAMLNPNPLGKKYYCKACFEEDPDQFWGKGVPELIKHAQQMGNSFGNKIIINAAHASGPLVEMNVNRLAPGETATIYPWKVIKVTDDMMTGSKAVNFFQPAMIVEQLVSAYEFALKVAEEDSGIPRYAHGNGQVGGAGQTASGLSMLMTQAARGIKAVIKNIDAGLIRPAVERQYHYNLEYEKEDFEIIGDLNVLAKGSSSLIAKEQRAIRISEYLAKTANPIDANVILPDMRLKMHREAMDAMEMDTDKILGDEDEIEDRMEEQAMMQREQMMMQGQAGASGESNPGGTPAGPRKLDAAGSPAQGQDNNLNAAPPGR